MVSSLLKTPGLRDERDFGIETETRVVSRPVSSFETTMQKSQSQNAMDGLLITDFETLRES